MENIFIQISALLVITVSVAFAVRILRQPLIIAYIAAGITCGPLFLNLLHDNREIYEVFAQFGVVLLLFVIGLNLNFNHLKSIGRVSFVTGIGQVVFTTIFGIAILLLLKMPLYSAAYLAVAMTFSSTIVIMKLLTEKKDTEKTYGRYTIGLMLVQDLIAVFILIFLGVMKGGAGEIAGSFFFLLVKAVIVMAGLYAASKYLIPRLLDRISYSSELLFIFTIAWCFGAASVLYQFGFSLEIGAIAAGIALSSSPYQPEIASRIKPLRDFFLVLFFVMLGGQMSLSDWSLIWVPGLVLSLFILIGNPFILYLLFRLLKFTRKNSFLSGLTAAQVSEFGFVILFVGNQMGHFAGEEVAIFTMVAILTIFVSSYLIIYNERIYRWMLPFFNLFGPDKFKQFNRLPAIYDAWLIGHHRIGVRVAEALKKKKTKFAVVDYNPDVIKDLRKKGIPSYFGDISDVEFLDEVPLPSARLVIMTVPGVEDQSNLIAYIRKFNAQTLIIANAYHRPEAGRLYRAGADYVMMPHYIGGAWIAEMLIKKRWTRRSFAALRAEETVRRPSPA